MTDKPTCGTCTKLRLAYDDETDTYEDFGMCDAGHGLRFEIDNAIKCKDYEFDKPREEPPF